MTRPLSGAGATRRQDVSRSENPERLIYAVSPLRVHDRHFPTRAIIAAGLTRFDAGAQGEHKLIRGFEPALTRSWHYLRHPGLREAVAAFLAQESDAVCGWLEEALGALPFRQG